LDWLLFIPQIPSSPSTLRVLVWRRLRSAGALALQSGIWILPSTPKQEQFARDLLIEVQTQGASGKIFRVTTLDEATERDILREFQEQRDEEYAEFLEQCDALLAEMDKETRARKFTFAELEENEHGLGKLETWLKKIQDRDFVAGQGAQQALERLEACRKMLQNFSDQVYAQQAMKPDEDEGDKEKE
jgi:vacuolar-type H+-ATPase subunit I/STV1